MSIETYSEPIEAEVRGIVYSSNNSGGGWWLNDDDWFALERAGWKVRWYRDDEHHQKYRPGDDRFLGALASSAFLPGATEENAIASFEEVTGESVTDEGCECCGPPHSFYEDWGPAA
ncbi:hypothetical protein A5630_25350 [Mycolicibacterium mucogenicum]|uniref:Uncharacterized protein n=1 Tax=Mycolicibacterium mucogenicum TaxID=56689 RepID=A0A1A3GWS5_MYCMU|nr:hypothetical protein [Mycolicibacterium mucogenicum]OBJ40280.1 hypothetical protein A5630_25350 [Mycolicibacterium mucogenicum]